MAAFAYLFLTVLVGDCLSSRFLTFISWPHRLAAAFIVGALASTWFTYLASLAFADTSNPMLWGNLVFIFSAAGFLIYERKTVLPAPAGIRSWLAGLDRADRWDLFLIAIFLIIATWMMFGTFGYSDGTLRIANHQWSDFGSTVSIMQSFAEGHNFPTEYPHFTGDRIRYHFLYYFQAGNLEFLGLNPALSNNLLSILSMVSMLVLVMTLGRVLFNSRSVGRIGAVFFFFHGTLAFIPFLISTGSSLLMKLSEMRDFVSSGLPYRGEDWGVWTQVVYLNQRHLASSIGVLLIVLIFLAGKYKAGNVEAAETGESDEAATGHDPRNWIERAAQFIFLGAFLGLLPLWNGALFASAGVVLGLAFLLFPLYRKEMLGLAAAAFLVSLPQIIFLKGGMARPAGYSLLNWGYVIDDPTPFNVGYYLFFIFGFKWLLVGAALYFGSSFQRRFMLAVSGLIALTFCFQFSDEVLTNHKFLNVWLVIANLFAAYGVVRLWNVNVKPAVLAARAAAITSVIAIFIGGALDIFPIRNSYWVEIRLKGDQLVEWLRENTDRTSIFLSHRYVNHRILMTGRRLFYGHPYYAWGAGHDTGGRDSLYKTVFESKDAAEVHRLLKENRIGYVALDNAVRRDAFLKSPNEALFDAYFPLVFSDTEGKYENLKIYRVPNEIGPVQALVPSSKAASTAVETSLPAISPFEGGEGNGPGQFSRPRGIAADAKGNFYVADTGNSRVQKFDADGRFLMQFGAEGDGEGQFRELNGVAVDETGAIWTVDAARHMLIKFDSSGSFVREWKGPEINFYGPRDLTFGPNNQLYVVDQGRTRVIRFDPAAERFTEWGSAGGGDGQFNEATGIGIGAKLVAVADAGNGRVQLFDLEGRFIRQWSVSAWAGYAWNRPDVAVSGDDNLIYVSSGLSREVIVYDQAGNVVRNIKPEGADELSNPTSLTIRVFKKYAGLLILNTGGEVGFSGDPSVTRITE